MKICCLRTYSSYVISHAHAQDLYQSCRGTMPGWHFSLHYHNIYQSSCQSRLDLPRLVWLPCNHHQRCLSLVRLLFHIYFLTFYCSRKVYLDNLTCFFCLTGCFAVLAALMDRFSLHLAQRCIYTTYV